ncbi:MAG: carbohydrate-binding protein [Planctomycetota bacterium]
MSDLAANLSCNPTLADPPPSSREYHVAVEGQDRNPGTATQPLRSIAKAAGLARPGDTVTVHAGTYREEINPPLGGESADRRITFRAASGEHVEIKGSEVVKGWEHVQNDTWRVVLPNSYFGDFNPYADPIRGDWFDDRGRKHHTGAVYLRGHWLVEAVTREDVLAPAGKRKILYTQSFPPSEYLMNVAWFAPGGATDAKVWASSFAANRGVELADYKHKEESGECIGWIRDGDWVKYERVDLGTDCQRIEVMACSNVRYGGVIEIRLDDRDGKLLGTCEVAHTDGWQNWKTQTAQIETIGGLNDICLVFTNPPDREVEVPVDNDLWYAEVDEQNTTIWAQFKDADPNASEVEINVRQSIIYPRQTGINYITVSGFKMAHAATNWAPPTAEQVGLIGTNWSKGWVIENNEIAYSVCTGITLGKHGDLHDNTSADSAEGYVKTIEIAYEDYGWSRENIGGHVVRNNRISHCEMAGLAGSLGCIFSEVTDNLVHDVHVRGLFSGAEMAGIKFHGAIDTLIARNQIRNTACGLWLDWMAQGTRVTRNLFHDNGHDIFFEVNHGPFVVDNNLFLSEVNVWNWSRGGAYAHNLFAGRMCYQHDVGRETPYLKAHSTEVAGIEGLVPLGDDKFFNNIFLGGNGLAEMGDEQLECLMAGNVFYGGAEPSPYESRPTVFDQQPGYGLDISADNIQLTINLNKSRLQASRRLVSTDVLGQAVTPRLSYLDYDGSYLKIERDYFDHKFDQADPGPGPFADIDQMSRFNITRLPV